MADGWSGPARASSCRPFNPFSAHMLFLFSNERVLSEASSPVFHLMVIISFVYNVHDYYHYYFQSI